MKLLYFPSAKTKISPSWNRGHHSCCAPAPDWPLFWPVFFSSFRAPDSRPVSPSPFSFGFYGSTPFYSNTLLRRGLWPWWATYPISTCVTVDVKSTCSSNYCWDSQRFFTCPTFAFGDRLQEVCSWKLHLPVVEARVWSENLFKENQVVGTGRKHRQGYRREKGVKKIDTLSMPFL